MKRSIYIIIIGLLPFIATAQFDTINSFKKISSTSGNFNGLTSGLNQLGYAVKCIGDINSDGVQDLAVGFYDANKLEGNLFILFLNSNFTVKSYTRIGPNIGGLNGSFPNSMQYFGFAIEKLNDIDGDGINEIVVGNFGGGVNSKGQVFIVFLNNQGSVKKYTTIGEQEIPLINNESFGWSISCTNDFDNDGIQEIAVCSTGNTDGGPYSGIIYILYLTSNGSLKKTTKISSKNGNFNGNITNGFAYSVSKVSDLDNDGIEDLVSSSFSPPALWVLFLDSTAKIKSYQKIANDSGGYTDPITPTELFGYSITNMADIDGDGNSDIAVSSIRDTLNGLQTGRVRLLFLNSNGTVKTIKRIDNNTTNFNSVLQDGDNFGSGLSGGFDSDGDFKNDLLVGAFGTDDGGQDKGAVYLLSLDGVVHPTPPQALWRVNAITGNQNTVFNFTQYSSGFPSNYKWSFTPNTVAYQNGTTDSSANPVVKFTQSANYSVQLKVTNPFSSDSLLRSNYISIQTTGLFNTHATRTQIELYPNPTTGKVTIESPVSMQHILVYDITGKQLLHQQPDGVRDELNLSELESGIYFIHVQTAQGVQMHKITKQ